MDLSAGAAILEDPGPATGAGAAASTHTIVVLSSLPLVYVLLVLFCFLVSFRRYFVCMYSYMGSDTVMYDV